MYIIKIAAPRLRHQPPQHHNQDAFFAFFASFKPVKPVNTVPDLSDATALYEVLAVVYVLRKAVA